MSKQTIATRRTMFAGKPALHLRVAKQNIYIPREQLREIADAAHDLADQLDAEEGE